jgi:hypothetical protein
MAKKPFAGLLLPIGLVLIEEFEHFPCLFSVGSCIVGIIERFALPFSRIVKLAGLGVGGG